MSVEKSLHGVNISLFVKIGLGENELLPFRAISDPRQWRHVKQLSSDNSCRVNQLAKVSEIMHQTWKTKKYIIIMVFLSQCFSATWGDGESGGWVGES